MDGGSYLSEARSWSNTPPPPPPNAANNWQNMAAGFTPRRGGGYQLQEELTSGWLIGYRGNQKMGMPLTTPFD